MAGAGDGDGVLTEHHVDSTQPRPHNPSRDLDLPGIGPLRLAPGIVCIEDRANEQVRLFTSRTLALDSGQQLSLQSVVGSEEIKERLPG